MKYPIFFKGDRLRHLHNQTPFFIFNKGALVSNLKEYRKHLPKKTEICYAMKANSERVVLQTLKDFGASFELASKYELTLLKKIKVSAKKIIYGAPVKPESHIKEFVKYGVDRFAFDSESELLKLARCAPKSRVYIRVQVDSKSNSVFNMSEKFGVPLSDTAFLLCKAKELGLMP